MISVVLHRLAEYSIILEFEEVLLKLVLCVFSSFGATIYVWLEPVTLGKFDDSMCSSRLNTHLDT